MAAKTIQRVTFHGNALRDTSLGTTNNGRGLSLFSPDNDDGETAVILLLNIARISSLNSHSPIPVAPATLNFTDRENSPHPMRFSLFLFLVLLLRKAILMMMMMMMMIHTNMDLWGSYHRSSKVY